MLEICLSSTANSRVRYLGSFLGPNGLTTKFLKENEEEPPELEWIKEYTEKYFVVERFP